ncbi:conserved protein of unknown function [Methylacidimicrobium sp. AP8]|uniref:AAA family ATPase n=1 Tax=Methylacidimicrobium sp. AP8 TaxID=2730359 RepID=UPI0018BFC8F8|nr:MoxR family ATPase [Methylacidimicrobium sp. AP8]CAB4242931.1 conserved protein of unknown function [Methylacidimicrobium sp. AP8]
MIDGPEWRRRIFEEVHKTVLGQDRIIERLLIALLCGGHVLIEGMPGLAKTLLVKSLSAAVGVQFERIQFTPDLLPSDVVGTMVFHPQESRFYPHLGPIFANIVLADEINRAPAKVQSALLEAMQERQVTLGGTAHRLPDPFLVLATQNPIEQEGTYPLPEAQADRFLFKVLVDYPSEEEERSMLRLWGRLTETPQISGVSSAEEIRRLRSQIDQVYVSPAIERYILELVRASRREKFLGGPKLLAYGASPRASLALLLAGRTLAWLRGLDYVTPALIREIVPDVLRHRVGLSYEAEAQGIEIGRVLEQLVESTAVPEPDQAGA